MIIGRLEILPILLAVVPHIYRAKALTRSHPPAADTAAQLSGNHLPTVATPTGGW